jgi:L-fucose isomerase-like protein
MQSIKQQSTLGVIIGNREFFPDKLVAEARTEVLDLFKKLNITPILLSHADSGSVLASRIFYMVP